jgi:hypothetical protein
MQQPRPLPPMVYVDVEVSYRWRGSEPVCAFVTVIEQRNTQHRRIAHTEHLHGSPEQLVDLVAARTRELTLEFVLAHAEPF